MRIKYYKIFLISGFLFINTLNLSYGQISFGPIHAIKKNVTKLKEKVQKSQKVNLDGDLLIVPPILADLLSPDIDGSYTISWNSVSGAISYSLEEADNSSFAGSTVAYTGSGISVNITGKTSGTYYYRVKAVNFNSDWSSTKSITVNLSPAQQWIKQLSLGLMNNPTGVTADNSENIYVTGYSDAGLPGNSNLVMYLVKYSSSGIKLWTKQMGSSLLLCVGFAVTTDDSDNIYVTGVSSGSFDGNTSFGGFDAFLVKYDAAGVKQWSTQFGSTSDDVAKGVATDSSGNVYVTGGTEGSLGGNTSVGGYDMFLVKYNSAGVNQWTRQLGTASEDGGQGITIDSSGNIYVTGETDGSLDGNISSGGTDMFLSKYDSSGIKLWTKQLGTGTTDSGSGVATDISGDIYVAGYTSGGLDGNISYGNRDTFLVKYNDTGSKQWTKQLGTNSNDAFYSMVTADGQGHVYVAGHTSIGFDGKANAGWYDIFLVEYNSSGSKQWGLQFGTSTGDAGTGVATDILGNIYVTGNTTGSIDGNTPANNDGNMFLVKYGY